MFETRFIVIDFERRMQLTFELNLTKLASKLQVASFGKLNLCRASVGVCEQVLSQLSAS